MKISIIVPIYKAEAYLRECVQSVLAQTFPDFELLLIDDGSPDGSGAICDAYAERDARVRVIHKPNGGASSARNAGLTLAAGEYLTFVDSDDLLHPAMLEFLLRAAEEVGAEASVCGYCGFETEPSFGEPTYAIRRIAPGRDFCLEPYRIEYVAPWAKLFRRELFSDLRFPEHLRMCEDEALLFRALYKCGRIAELETVLYGYRATPGSTMNAAFSKKNYDIIPALKDRLSFYVHAEDEALVRLTQTELRLLRAKLSLKARHAGCYEKTHPEDRVGKLTALRRIRQDGNVRLYDWYLGITWPRAARLRARLRAAGRKLRRG